MEKKLAGLLGAAAALTTVGAAQAVPAAPPQTLPAASSYTDLLEPVPNASAVLAADDQRVGDGEARVQLAQYYYYHHHHHHHRHVYVIRRHHHHHHYRRYYYHHHHHHHHYYGSGFGIYIR